MTRATLQTLSRLVEPFAMNRISEHSKAKRIRELIAEIEAENSVAGFESPLRAAARRAYERMLKELGKPKSPLAATQEWPHMLLGLPVVFADRDKAGDPDGDPGKPWCERN